MKSINQLTNQFAGPASQAFFPDTATNVAAPVCGLDAVSALGSEHGIVISHLAILAALAEELDIVFAFRPVNPLATQLIEQNYPTKNLTIKGKSSDWGPMAGFIPVRQEWSKLAGKPEEIDKSNASVQECIADGHAVAQPLTINMARLNALHRLGVIEKRGKIGLDSVLLFAEKAQVRHTFKGSLVYEKGVANYTITHQGQIPVKSAKPPTPRPGAAVKDQKLALGGQCLIDDRQKMALQERGMPLEVLAKIDRVTRNMRPLTADYDVFMFAVPIGSYGNEDSLKPSLKSQTPRRLSESHLKAQFDTARASSPAAEKKSSVRHWRGPRELPSPTVEVPEPEPAPDHGISSPRFSKFIPVINRALGRSPSNGAVQHGPDTQNPHTVMADNTPCVFFMPKRVGKFGGVVMARSVEEMSTICKLVKEEGFHFFGNDKWTGEMSPIALRRPSFNTAQKIVGLRLRQSALSTLV